MGTEGTPTELGYLLLRLMQEINMRPFGIAKAAGFGSSTLSRIINGDVNPDPTTLRRLAEAFVTLSRRQAGVSDDATRDEEVADLEGRLMAAAGYGVGTTPAPISIHPLALELNQLIGEGSKLSKEEITFLVDAVTRFVEPHRRKVRKRTG